MKSGKIVSLFPAFLIQYTNTKTAASCADFTTSSNFGVAVCKDFGALSLAETSGTNSRNGRDAVSVSLKLGTATCRPSLLLTA